MSLAETALSARTLVTLSAGNALAVVLSLPVLDPLARDRAAEQALREETERTDIVIGRRPSGRPRLFPPYDELAISLARRKTVLVAGFAPTGRVGVDVEVSANLVRNDPVRLARDHFSPAEAAYLEELEPDRARDMFLRLWVAKEALLKCTGRGVFDGLADPDLSSELDAVLRGDGDFTPQARDWREYRVSLCRLPAVVIPRTGAATAWIYAALAAASR